MRPAPLALALLAGLSGPAAAGVSVRYVAPERFTDAENRIGSGLPLRVTLAEMTRILQELGDRHLPPGETLAITILDIDLAGVEQLGFGTAQALRVVRDSSPPRIRFAYRLQRGGRTLAQGEETLTDINFLLTSNARFSSGPLFYERALLRDWFRRRFPSG
ncbi:DUF3016 domain-containing protein [Methylobacterium durans]|uniref:DUF3016 domain-containing protein n=1 Tax=Methylobacterium durans TaxID=2202825 RepID=A0A2U8W763_9HYPH|nr:DUF3016 domain-containing protein [Methylobacterium durans]AWN41438.1 DUF3016 domain-containing protein [Methylobacterium durans]